MRRDAWLRPWIFACLTLAPLASAAPAASSHPDHGAAASPPIAVTDSSGVAVIPFRLVNNHVLVRGTVNDSDSLWFIIDTGAYDHVFNTSTAARLKIPVRGESHAMGSGGNVKGGRVGDVKISLRGMQVRGVTMAAIPLDMLGIQNGVGCDGVIGHPFFKENAVEIDYDRGTITVRPSDRFDYRGDGATLPLTYEQRHPYVQAKVGLAGQKPIEGRFVIDSGSSMALALGPSFIEQHKARESVPRLLQVRMGGVGGMSTQVIGRIETLQLGPYTLTGPITTFRAAGPGSINAEGTAGNIGGEVLRRFHVIFDYARDRMILEPSASFAEPFEADMSGLGMRVREDGTHAIEVAIVQEKSPASELKVEPGDVVETFDGVPVTSATMLEVRKRLRQDGKSYRVGLRRGDKPYEISLITRRLI